MTTLNKTIFFKRHEQLGAKIVEFGGWEMPIQYPDGILAEHIKTREKAGIFDVSHMGRIVLTGNSVVAFLQYVLSNNAQALEVGQSQYTLIQNETGGALDDAYLYRFKEEEYLLVVNASNREKDLAHLSAVITQFPDVKMKDKTFEIAMISLQGPLSKDIMEQIINEGYLPEPTRNCLSTVRIDGSEVLLARTGYTGEPICFELFIENGKAVEIWDRLIEKGAAPIGLGARDTLRLEACLPLYGHELGIDHDNNEIPVFASKLSKFAVSFSELKGDFIGKNVLTKQHEAFKRIVHQDYSDVGDLPRMIMALAVTGKGIGRAGHRVFKNGEHVGYITSGTSVPYRLSSGGGLEGKFESDIKRRTIALALIDSNIKVGDTLEIEIRKKMCEAVVVPYHMSSQAPPYVRVILHDQVKIFKAEKVNASKKKLAGKLLSKAVSNNNWRQKECVNLIPSEMSQSLLSRMLSISDPVNRYAEHKEIKAFSSEDIFYYQGTEFIEEVEFLLNKEFQSYFGCKNIESRVISGQMANAACFSGLVDFINRADRKSEQRRIGKILNNHIIKGGHLSAQPMGALRDFVARDLKTEKPAVVNFPVLQDNPYKIDVQACENIIKIEQPELIILGKSMVIHKEPVREIRAFVDEYVPSCIIMYDMAHVLGLYGDQFQSPLQEGAHIVTGSTHKTFFGTQRGVIASDFAEDDLNYEFWEAIQRRTFPGSVSNHHLGTMTGLLFAAYEMNFFKEEYQRAVINNAKAFAIALKDEGLDVAGDPEINFTETHQVIVHVGYGKGANVAKQLEENNIIVNYQATPAEEGFTASGALRLGVSEMTRFGMKQKDFQELASLMADLIKNETNIKEKVKSFRERFLDMNYCFNEDDFGDIVSSLMNSL
ncbi:MAG TPA: glycine cleavage system aminomethyltransferase GcvT [Desulfobacterales bacterium]|nr:glycine cleavage system aminomethyltransferase GcvT [Desulfobacterales bacterium]HIP39512.1 glycine cleavage system aminomethyltransferase GcvT [Desulfocapsa sulfexigens]